MIFSFNLYFFSYFTDNISSINNLKKVNIIREQQLPYEPNDESTLLTFY